MGNTETGTGTLAYEVGVWLRDYVDSHTIYDTGMLDELKEFGIGIVFEDNRNYGHCVRFSADTKPNPCRMLLTTNEQMRQRIIDRGLGGNLAEDNGELLFGGCELSAALCQWLTGDDAGAKFFGRGSAHRACIEALIGS